MFSSISRGWAMAGASWKVLKQHPKLLFLPVISGLAFIALCTAIILPVAMFAIANGVETLQDRGAGRGPAALSLWLPFLSRLHLHHRLLQRRAGLLRA